MLRINGDDVAVLNQADRAAFLRFGDDMTDKETVRAARKTSIGQERDAPTQTGTHQG